MDGFLGTIVMFVLMFFGQIAGVILVDKVNDWLCVDIATKTLMYLSVFVGKCMASQTNHKVM